MSKVYCENCEFAHGTFVCYWDALQLLKEELTGEEMKAYLWENHNCPYYKRKWWKFFITRGV